MPVTAFCITVTSQVSVKPPSLVVAVIVAVPAEIPFTTPFVTVATFALDEVQVIPFLVAFSGVIIALIVSVLPFSTSIDFFSKVIPITATCSGAEYVTFV